MSLFEGQEVELTIEAMRAGALMVVESPGGAGFAPHNDGRDRLFVAKFPVAPSAQ